MRKQVQSVVAEITLKYRNKQAPKERPIISTSSDAHRILLQAFDPDTIEIQETFVVMFLNRANQVLGTYRCSNGGVTGTVADPRLILATALKSASVSLILAHNHPSGSLKPSRQDEELTAKIQQGAKFMDIKVLDHLIISPDRTSFLSFADEGLL